MIIKPYNFFSGKGEITYKKKSKKYHPEGWYFLIFLFCPVLSGTVPFSSDFYVRLDPEFVPVVTKQRSYCLLKVFLHLI
jgi:hypothetical protein